MVDISLHDGGRELTSAAIYFKEILSGTLAEDLPVKRQAKSIYC
jgi:hypothetical protein